MTPLKKQGERVLSMATYFARPSPPPLKRENILLRLAGFVLEQPKYSLHAAFLICSIKGWKVFQNFHRQTNSVVDCLRRLLPMMRRSQTLKNGCSSGGPFGGSMRSLVSFLEPRNPTKGNIFWPSKSIHSGLGSHACLRNLRTLTQSLVLGPGPISSDSWIGKMPPTAPSLGSIA